MSKRRSRVCAEGAPARRAGCAMLAAWVFAAALAAAGETPPATNGIDFWRAQLLEPAPGVPPAAVTAPPAALAPQRQTPAQVAPPPPFFQGTRPTSVAQPIRYSGGIRPSAARTPATVSPVTRAPAAQAKPAASPVVQTPAQVAPSPPFFQGTRPTSVAQPIRYSGGTRPSSGLTPSTAAPASVSPATAPASPAAAVPPPPPAPARAGSRAVLPVPSTASAGASPRSAPPAAVAPARSPVPAPSPPRPPAAVSAPRAVMPLVGVPPPPPVPAATPPAKGGEGVRMPPPPVSAAPSAVVAAPAPAVRAAPAPAASPQVTSTAYLPAPDAPPAAPDTGAPTPNHGAAGTRAGAAAGTPATFSKPNPTPVPRTGSAMSDPNFKPAIVDAQTRVNNFQQAVKSGNAAAAKAAAVEVRHSTIAPQMMNQMNTPDGAQLRGQMNQVYEGQVVGPASAKTAAQLSTPTSKVEPKAFTGGPNQQGGVVSRAVNAAKQALSGPPGLQNKVGADNDITYQQTRLGPNGKPVLGPDGKPVTSDVPYQKAQTVMQQNLHQQIKGTPAPSPQAASALRQSQRVEITDGSHLEAYPKGFFEPNTPIDGGHLTQAANFKNMEPFQHGQSLLNQAANAPRSVTPAQAQQGVKTASQLNIEAQNQLYEGFRTMAKQGTKLQGVVQGQGGDYSPFVKKGIEISKAVETGKISPQQAMAELKAMGTDYQTMSELIAGQGEAALTLAKPLTPGQQKALKGITTAGKGLQLAGKALLGVDGIHRVQNSLYVYGPDGQILREKTPEEKAQSAVSNIGGLTVGLAGAAAGGKAGAAAGAAIGGALGSAVPVVGNIVGAAAGGLLGGLAGGVGGYMAGSAAGSTAAGAAYGTIDPANMTPEERQALATAKRMHAAMLRNGVPPELAGIVTGKFLNGNQAEWKQYMTEIRKQFGPGASAGNTPPPGGAGSGEAKLGGVPQGGGSSTNTALGQLVDGKQQTSSQNATNALAGSAASQQVTDGSNAGDAQVAQAGAVVNAAGNQAQATQLASTRTAAGQQQQGSLGNAIGSGLVTGVTAGVSQGLTVLGQGAGGQIASTLTGGHGQGSSGGSAPSDPNVTVDPEGNTWWTCPKCGDGYTLHPGEAPPSACPFCGQSAAPGGTQVASSPASGQGGQGGGHGPGHGGGTDPGHGSGSDPAHGGGSTATAQTPPAHGGGTTTAQAPSSPAAPTPPGGPSTPSTRIWTCSKCGGQLTLGPNDPDPADCPFGAYTGGTDGLVPYPY